MNWVSLRRGAILESLLGILHRPAAAAARSGGPAMSGTAAKRKTVSMAVLAQLHALLSAHGDGMRDPLFLCCHPMCLRGLPALLIATAGRNVMVITRS